MLTVASICPEAPMSLVCRDVDANESKVVFFQCSKKDCTNMESCSFFEILVSLQGVASRACLRALGNSTSLDTWLEVEATAPSSSKSSGVKNLKRLLCRQTADSARTEPVKQVSFGGSARSSPGFQ